MIVLWGVLRDVFPDSGSVPGQHWHQKIECNLHVYLRLFHGHSYSISTRQSCPKALICRHFYSVYRKDAVLQHLFCPAEYCVSVRCVVKHGAASRPWSWLICAVRVRCCFIPTVWGYSLVINKYIYKYDPDLIIMLSSKHLVAVRCKSALLFHSKTVVL